MPEIMQINLTYYQDNIVFSFFFFKVEQQSVLSEDHLHENHLWLYSDLHYVRKNRNHISKQGQHWCECCSGEVMVLIKKNTGSD